MAKTLTNLRSLTRYYALGSSVSTDYSDADTLLNLDTRYQEAFLVAADNDGDYEFNGDGSQSISITSGVRAYTLATDLFKIDRVEIKYPSSANDYLQATQINGNKIQQLGKDNYITGRPEFDLMADSIEIFVGDKTSNISAITSGIKVYYQKELTELEDADDEIILPDVFARYIAIGAAIDYCGVFGLVSRLGWLNNEHQVMEQRLKDYISKRNKAKPMRISFKKESYGDTNYNNQSEYQI